MCNAFIPYFEYVNLHLLYTALKDAKLELTTNGLERFDVNPHSRAPKGLIIPGFRDRETRGNDSIGRRSDKLGVAGYSDFAKIDGKVSDIGELFSALSSDGLPAEEALAAKMALRRALSKWRESEHKGGRQGKVSPL